MYNHQILKIFNKVSKETIPLRRQHSSLGNGRLKEVMNRAGGVMEWAASHNCSFGTEKFQLVDLSRCKTRWDHGKEFRYQEKHYNLTGRESSPSLRWNLHIDRELRWKEQMAAATGKGREWLRGFQVGIWLGGGSILQWSSRESCMVQMCS